MGGVPSIFAEEYCHSWGEIFLDDNDAVVGESISIINHYHLYPSSN